MKWLSSKEQFGFVSPVDGGPDVFVRFSSPEDRPVADDIAPPERPGQRAEPHRLATKVEIRTRYQVGHWAAGYEIAKVVATGYHVRRPGSEAVLPEIFAAADVRRAGDQ